MSVWWMESSDDQPVLTFSLFFVSVVAMVAGRRY